jgi:hypothetical protein
MGRSLREFDLIRENIFIMGNTIQRRKRIAIPCVRPDGMRFEPAVNDQARVIPIETGLNSVPAAETRATQL